MRLFNLEVFKGSVSGLSAPVYTSAEFSSVLAEAERYFVQAVVTQAAGTTPKLQVNIETSNDGNNWVSKAVAIPATALTVNGVTVLSGNDPGTTPAGMFVRFSLFCTNNVDNSCNVRLFVCGRAEQNSL